jgi:hypothetical protein
VGGSSNKVIRSEYVGALLFKRRVNGFAGDFDNGQMKHAMRIVRYDILNSYCKLYLVVYNETKELS